MTKPARLKLVVRTPRRPSLIVDVEHGQTMTPPWSLHAATAMMGAGAPVPLAVASAMWIASWAAAEHADLCLTAGRLEASARYEPSEALYAAIGSSIGGVIGVLGFGVPVRFRRYRDGDERVYVGWPRDFDGGS